MTTAKPFAPSPTARLKGRNIFAVASGKGGVGKTWFSITLAQCLTKLGAKTLLFDGDLGLANLDIQLGLMPKHDLGSVIAGRIQLDKSVDHFEDGGFDVVAGRSGSGGLANVAPSRLTVLGEELGLLATGYDHVIIDAGAGVEKNVMQLTGLANTCIVLVTDEPTSLTDAYAFIKLTRMERPGTDIRVVVNMANSVKEGEKTFNTLKKACEGFLKFKPTLLGIVRRDTKVPDSIRNQAPILTRYPNAEAASDVEAIAKLLTSEPD
ncbi:MAG: MinD/ParA family protein [Magnetovibrionaceae bacterium]